MVKLLIRDIASPDHNDTMFPFLRCFDPYAGHSWASGHSRFADGNNNESSSEAMNAWSGVILFGEATGDRTLRDLGIYLFYQAGDTLALRLSRKLIVQHRRKLRQLITINKQVIYYCESVLYRFVSTLTRVILFDI